MENLQMKTKSTLILILLLLATLVAACASPTATTSNTTSNNVVVPTTVSSVTAEPASSTSNTVDIATSTTDTTSSSAIAMDPSLACANGQTSANQTVSLTEGPYYTPNTPERSTLYEDGMAGIKLTLVGYVYDTNCQPVANAWLDFWQADANGVYDNTGYILRGNQYTDANGRYELVTVIPGIYPGRTEHIHFKVQAPNGKLITSQLFFPGVTQNDEDGIYDPSLLIILQQSNDGMMGQFNFVVPAS